MSVDRMAVTARTVKVWSCTICGPSVTSRRNWCDRGCGPDYNRMVEVEYVPAEQLRGAVEALRGLYRLHMDRTGSIDVLDEAASILDANGGR